MALPKLKKNITLAPYTTYKIGGTADWFVEVKTTQDLIAAVQSARKKRLPYFILGCGANILVRDGGWRGLVVRNVAKKFKFLPENKLWTESGATIADLIKASSRRGLSGLEHYVGIPSTVGGAIWQNLHFLSPNRRHLIFIEEVVASAKILDKRGLIKTVDRDFFQFGYDDSLLHRQELVVLEVTFQLHPKPRAQIENLMRRNLARRIAKQPQLTDFPSCGSVFKKIEGVGAGRLLEKAGLKGKRVGQAEISTKHANYFVNLGGATAADVESLIKLAQKEVKEKLGYELETEITIVGKEKG